MPEKIRPIDANALEREIREYMADIPNATARLIACRAILSMLGDENQTPTLSLARDTNVPSSFAGDNHVGRKGEQSERERELRKEWIELNNECIKVLEGATKSNFSLGVEFGMIEPMQMRKKQIEKELEELKRINPYPPARIDREKWEPCEWCGSFGKTSDNWVCTLEDDDGHTVTNNHIVVCATANYCPSCGRPITEQAWAELVKRSRG